MNGKLDMTNEESSIDVKELSLNRNFKNKLRLWENSNDITDIYKLIFKNRKQIKYKLFESNLIVNKYGKQYVASSTLIYVMKKMFPKIKLSNIQWEIIADIGKSESNDILVNIPIFFKLMEINAKKI